VLKVPLSSNQPTILLDDFSYENKKSFFGKLLFFLQVNM